MIELSPGDLPAYCPNPAMPLWSSHPRVFLDVVNEREVICPYCSTRYRLKRDTRIEGSEFDAYRLHQHHETPIPEPASESGRYAARRFDRRETPNLTADALGHSPLELMTQWLRRRG